MVLFWIGLLAIPNSIPLTSLIEHWGSGIPCIMGKVKAYGLRDPEFIGGEVDLRINIYRNQLNAASAARDISQHNVSADKVPTNEQERQIYNYVLENPSITTTQAATLLNIGQRRARNLLVKMVDDRWLNKEGASRSTVYVINHDPV